MIGFVRFGSKLIRIVIEEIRSRLVMRRRLWRGILGDGNAVDDCPKEVTPRQTWKEVEER